jgi:Glycosyltransferase
MHITIAISSLGQGGAERIASIMANYWGDRGHRVSIVTLSKAETAPAYPLGKSIELYNLGLSGQSDNVVHGALGNFKRVWEIRKNLRHLKPDVVISFMDTMNVLILLASRGLHLPVIVTEHCHPVQFPLGKMWHLLRKCVYPYASAVVVLGTEIKQWFAKHLHSKRLEIIHNPVIITPCPIVAKPRECGTIISAGRLVEEKQFMLLIEAFVPLAHDFPHWKLVIHGEGPERSRLEQKIQETGLHDQISLPGWADDIHSRMAQADIFALTSRSEAFPGALCEAMACGLPAVSFNCPSGPAEIIRPGRDGVLVPVGDIEALTRELRRFMDDEGLRKTYGERAEKILKRFSLDETMKKWELLIQDSLC